MSLLTTKFIFAASILALTLIAAFIPFKIAKHNSRFLSISDFLASGIFLGAGLLHLLPDAVNKFQTLHIDIEYPIAYVLCASAFLLFIVLEKGISIYGKVEISGNKIIAPIFLTFILSIHALVEGAAIGINSSFFETTAIFLAVFAHKGSESFALSANLHRLKISKSSISKIISIFALMTPIGIFIASSIMFISKSTTANLLEGIFSAVAAGTFLYLGTEHLFEEKTLKEQSSEVVALIAGTALMAIVAIWV